MADGTAIEWTHRPGSKGETWNPLAGCSVYSPGCTHCYAMRMAARIEAINAAAGTPTHYAGTTRKVKGIPVWTGKVALAPDHILTAPLRWKSPRTVFVNSMSDLFHEDVPDAWIDQVFAVMALAPQHTFQVLTKRAKRMRKYVTDAGAYQRILRAAEPLRRERPLLGSIPISDPRHSAFWPQLWLGVSAEDQTRADERIPDLLATPAAIRFVSAEPLLGRLDMGWALSRNRLEIAAGLLERGHFAPGLERLRPLNWIIAGGESGPNARPMHPDWPRSIRDQCAAAGVPFFFKQWGAHRPLTGAEHGQACGATLIGSDSYDTNAYVLRVGKKAAGRLLDGIEHNAFPEVRHGA